MKVTQTTSNAVATPPGGSDLDGSPQSRPTKRKAVFGGIISATPAVAAHVRKKTADTGQRLNSLQLASVATLGEPNLDGSSQSQPPRRKAVFGGIISTTPAVAAHVRRKMAHTGQGSPRMNQPKKA